MGSPDDEASFEQRGAEAGWELRVETCRIVLWRGYTTAAFYARATGDPHGAAIGEPSSSFRWRRRGEPDTEAARLAHHELVSRLKRDGWTATGGGADWYETQLSRPVLVPALTAAADPAPVEAPPPEREQAVLPPPPRPAPPARALPPHRVPAAAAAPARSSSRLDAWRVAAAAGLAAAIALLGWVASHPSAVGAAPLPRPELTE